MKELSPLRNGAEPILKMQVAALGYGLLCWGLILLGLLKRKKVIRWGAGVASDLVDLTKDRSTSILDIFHPLTRIQRFGIFSVTCVLVLTLFVRSWDNLTIPSLYIEDTWWYFNGFATGFSDFSNIFINENGYPVVITKFLAWLIGHVGVSIQPYIYLYLALFVSLLCVLTFFYFGLFQSWTVLLVGPFVLCLSGISHIFYLTTLSYVIFTGVILLLILLLLPEPKSLIGLVVRMITVSTLTWVGPYTVLTLPVAILVLVFFKTSSNHKLLLIWSMLCAIAYFFFVESGTADPLSIIRNPRYLITYLTVLFDRVFFLDLFGYIESYQIILFLLILSALFYLFINDRAYIKFGLILFVVIILNLYLTFGSVKYSILRKVMDNYLFISYFFWLVFGLMTIDRLLMRYRQPVIASIVTGTVLLLFVYIDNQAHTDKMAYPTRPGMAQYLKDVKFLEKNSNLLVKKKLYVEHFGELVKPNIKKPYAYFGYDGPGKVKIDIMKLNKMARQ